jgi:hypothetical protein
MVSGLNAARCRRVLGLEHDGAVKGKTGNKGVRGFVWSFACGVSTAFWWSVLVDMLLLPTRTLGMSHRSIVHRTPLDPFDRGYAERSAHSPGGVSSPGAWEMT